MPFDARSFMNAAQREVDDRLDMVVEIQKSTALAALEHLATASPVWTGWYQSNHRLALGEDIELSSEPSEEARALGTGELFVDPGALVARERAAIEELRIGDVIQVANAVPYSTEIEEQGTKTRPAGLFYRNAHDAAEIHATQQVR